jgi:hypothetical protein
MFILKLPIKFRSRKCTLNSKLYARLGYITAAFIYNKHSFNILLSKEQVEFLFNKNLFFISKIFKIKFLNKSIFSKITDLGFQSITKNIIHVVFTALTLNSVKAKFYIPIRYESLDSKFKEYTNILKNNVLLSSDNFVNLPNMFILNTSSFKINKSIKFNDLISTYDDFNRSDNGNGGAVLVSYFSKK